MDAAHWQDREGDTMITASVQLLIGILILLPLALMVAVRPDARTHQRNQ